MFSSTGGYISHSFLKEGVEDFVRQLRRTRPRLWWSIQCYHYETRTRTVTSSNNGKRQQEPKRTEYV
eukprot:UN01435